MPHTRFRWTVCSLHTMWGSTLETHVLWASKLPKMPEPWGQPVAWATTTKVASGWVFALVGPTFGLVTFTLPYQLRALAWQHQKMIYSLFFACVSSTLKDFGLNPDNLGVDMGMTAVLHTHSRRLDYHPHIHVVVPGGGVDKRKKQWTKSRAYEGKNLKGNICLMSLLWLKYFVPVFWRRSFKRDFIFPQKRPRNGWSIVLMWVRAYRH